MAKANGITPAPGLELNRWTLLRFDVRRKSLNYWICRCKCGVERSVIVKDVLAGKSRSCGCLQRETVLAMNYTHRMTGVPEYAVWASMISRCTNPKEAGFKNYGARGISVSERWLGDSGFRNFMADMGHRPSPKHTLERKDNDKGYGPDNCCWATRKEQARNKRDNRLIEFQGRTQVLSAWAEELGLNVITLHSRLGKLGWTIQRALSTPTAKHHRQSRIFSHRGKTQRLSEWAKQLNVPYGRLLRRLQLGWSIERLLETP